MSRTRFFEVSGLLVILSAAWIGCVDNRQSAELGAVQAELATYQAAESTAKANLDNFDDLDFNVFSGQKWNELSRSHAQNIEVHWPDGRTTTGMEAHVQDLGAMFVYAPDTRIKEHPIKVAQGEWTAVMGVMEGTFTQPMPIGDGKSLAPTGQAFKLPMATFGRWEDGVMVEEYLFWDNQAFMKQIGVVP